VAHGDVAHLPHAPRASLPSVDPEAQVQWFSRDLASFQPFQDEPATAVDIPIVTNGWDEENDTEPTLVLRRRALG
jgi:hypothetical protein